MDNDGVRTTSSFLSIIFPNYKLHIYSNQYYKVENIISELFISIIDSSSGNPKTNLGTAA